MANAFFFWDNFRNRKTTTFFLALIVTLGAVVCPQTRADETTRFEHPEAVEAIYRDRENQPVWISSGCLNPAAEIFIDLLRNADREGLSTSDYQAEALAGLASRDDNAVPFMPDPLGQHVDLLLTDAFLSYGLDMNSGRLDPGQVYSRWDFSRNGSVALTTLVDLLVTAPSAQEEPGFDPVAALDLMRPDQPDYNRLQEALGFFRHVADSGGWPSLPAGEILRPGDRGSRVSLLRTRLTGLAEPDHYDDDLVAAVRSFQTRHGLLSDGLVGEKTLAALNKSAAHKADLIALNLERIRWLPPEPDSPFIQVNIPSCRLDLMDQGQSVLNMKTVVGRPDRPTPVMLDRILWLELNPYWNVPQKLARRDILPKVLLDPQYLRDRDFHVYENWKKGAEEIDVDAVDWAGLNSWDIAFRFRQDPGPRNPLGRMKFLFPNQFSIYLHDTNQRDAFARENRWLSSGCVRLEDPDSLARFLAPDVDLTALLESQNNRTISLENRISILMVYQTVWIDNAGQVNFAPDIYGYDARMKLILEGEGGETLVSN